MNPSSGENVPEPARKGNRKSLKACRKMVSRLPPEIAFLS
jgi:hypothetical protein